MRVRVRDRVHLGASNEDLVFDERRKPCNDVKHKSDSAPTRASDVSDSDKLRARDVPDSDRLPERLVEEDEEAISIRAPSMAIELTRGCNRSPVRYNKPSLPQMPPPPRVRVEGGG